MRFIVLSLTLAATLCSAAPRSDERYVPPGGFVPDPETAIAIAVAVWKPIYGAKKIDGESPFRAKLVEGVWHVEGTLAPGVIGGVAEARISKKDGRVLHVNHGQ